MSEAKEGPNPEAGEIGTKSRAKEYLRSTTNYEAEQAHINRSSSPFKNLLQKLHDAKLTNAGIIDRIRGSKK